MEISIVDSRHHLIDRIAAQCAPLLPAPSSILVGLSGGMDSVVLLHLLHQLAPRFDWRLSALHVHHGISPNADAWADFCSVLCARYGIPLTIEHVDIAPLRDEHGIEAAARKLRHAAFARQQCGFVALAHHADDQVETLLLQLLRGAGVKGAAAMSVLNQVEGHALLRPLLNIGRGELLDYAQQHDLRWIEDESNADDSYPRNFLRHRVLPLLEQRFPAWRATLNRSAAHFAEAAQLLDELARMDAQEIFPAVGCAPRTMVHGMHPPKSDAAGEPEAVVGWARSCAHADTKPRGQTKTLSAHPTPTPPDAALEISRLQSLSPPRAKNLLRYFLHEQGAPMPQAAQLEDMLRQLCGARRDAAVCIAYGDYRVRRYQGRVYVSPALGVFDRDLVLPWNGESELAWPALAASIRFRNVLGQGVSLAKLQRAVVTLRLRRGGETLRPNPNAATRTLKNLLQEHHVPPWQRERLPLLYCGDELACVAGIAVTADFQATPSEAGIVVV